MLNRISAYLANQLNNFIKSNAHDTGTGTDPSALTTDDPFSFGFGSRPDIELEKIVNRTLTNSKFDYTCFQLMAYSVGSGFINTTESETPRAKSCLETINKFTTDWELQQKNQIAAYEVWASGNTFYNTPGEGNKIEGLYYMPLGSVVAINRTNKEVISYTQQTGGAYETVLADQVFHFKMNQKNGSAFGEYIGQPMERRGQGYRASNGKLVQKPSGFDSDEMVDDVVPKMIYSGQSKFIVTPSDKDASISSSALTSLRDAFNKLDPLKHIITKNRVNVTSTELSSQSKHDTFIEKHDRNFNIGMKSPFIALIGKMDFSYASSQTALDTAIPAIKIFKTNYGLAIEDHIYRNLIIQDGKNPDKIKIHLNWISIDSLNIDFVRQAYEITKNPEFVDLVDPMDILKMLNETGAKFVLKDEQVINMIRNLKRQNQIEKAIKEVADSRHGLNDILTKVKDKKTNL